MVAVSTLENVSRPTSQPANDSSLTVSGQIARLRSTFEDRARTGEQTAPLHSNAPHPTPVPPATARVAIWSRVTKSLLALIVAIAFGWMPLERLLSTTSAEAVVNARLVAIRAPIDGVVAKQMSGLEVGTLLHSGDLLLTLTNDRVDQSSLNGLENTKSELLTTAASLSERLRLLESHNGQLADQLQRFRKGRIAQIESKVAELDANIASAVAVHDVAAKSLSRQQLLAADGLATRSSLEAAVQVEDTDKQNVIALQRQREGALVELNAAKSGTFIGDSYNDTPQSAQRGLDVELELADTRARLTGVSRQIADLDHRIEEEAARANERSQKEIRSTVTGRIWEVSTAPNEYAVNGQVLLRILDCDSALVTATVSEANYQELSLGQLANFKPRAGGGPYQGWIVSLNGLAAVGADDAIPQKDLAIEPYHVTVRFPGLAGKQECDIGRSGLVTFDTTLARHVVPPLDTVQTGLGAAAHEHH